MENKQYSVEEMIQAFGVYLSPPIDTKTFGIVGFFEPPRRHLSERELDEMTSEESARLRIIIEQWMKDKK